MFLPEYFLLGRRHKNKVNKGLKMPIKQKEIKNGSIQAGIYRIYGRK